MNKTTVLVLALAITITSVTALGAPPTPDPKRVNKAIELLERGQPIYYTTSRGGYEEGKKLAQTWADYINYELDTVLST